MPSTETKSSLQSSFFGRFTGKRQAQDSQPPPVQPPPIPPSDPVPPPSSAGRTSTPPPRDLREEPEPDAELSPSKRLQQAHKRESSFASITNSVSDLGANVRRSVSLRSHRTHGSGGSIGGDAASRPVSRYQNSKSPPAFSPIERIESNPERQSREPPTPPRSRGRLALATRTLSQRFKSAEHLPLNISPEKAEPDSKPPPVPNIDDARFAMLAAGIPQTQRNGSRPSLPSSQQSSFSRDLTTSHTYSSMNGAVTTQFPASGGHNPSAVLQVIQETSRKRISTMEYLRQAHDGNVFYFNTLHYNIASLSQMPSLSPHKLGRRATSYMILGYSLPAVLDLNSTTPLEYLKALTSLLAEFETYQTLAGYDSSGNSIGRGRMGQMFKSGMGLGHRGAKGRRSSTAADLAFDPSNANKTSLSVPQSASDTGSPQDVLPSPITGHEFHHLLTPHLPFEPDFGTTFATLCDALIDVYTRLLDMLSSPEMCGPSVGEAFSKADKAIRKILVANVVREFEEVTRGAVRGEVAGLGKLVLGGFV